MTQYCAMCGLTTTQLTTPTPLMMPCALPLYWRRTHSIRCKKSLSTIVSSNTRSPSAHGVIVPHQTRCHLILAQKSIDGIVTHVFGVIRKIRQWLIDRADQQVLAIIQSGWSHAQHDRLFHQTCLDVNL